MKHSEAVVDEDWEYRRLQLPPGVSRRSAATQLSTVRLYSDGTRRIWLRRRRLPASAVNYLAS